MTKEEVLKELEKYRSEQTKKVLKNHGAREPFYGVKIADIKKIQKKIKKDHELAMQLYDTGNTDAMFLASLIADEKKITKSELQQWVSKAYWSTLSEYAVAWIAAESNYGWELALEWIESGKENVAAAGWATFTSIIAIKHDKDIDLDIIKALMHMVESEIHSSQNRVKYTMNNFLIAVGSYIISLTEHAEIIAASIGKVNVNMGKTSCKVPLASQYIQVVKDRGRVGKKKKKARC